MIFGTDRGRLRRVYVEAWRKHRAGAPLEPLEALVAAVIEMHPEHHALLEDERGVEARFDGGAGGFNPFLHLALHVAVREQVAADRPPGARYWHERLRGRDGDAHAAEHAMMACLEACLRGAGPGAIPDESAYLRCLAERARRAR